MCGCPSLSLCDASLLVRFFCYLVVDSSCCVCGCLSLLLCDASLLIRFCCCTQVASGNNCMYEFLSPFLCFLFHLLPRWRVFLGMSCVCACLISCFGLVLLIRSSFNPKVRPRPIFQYFQFKFYGQIHAHIEAARILYVHCMRMYTCVYLCNMYGCGQPYSFASRSQKIQSGDREVYLNEEGEKMSRLKEVRSCINLTGT